MFKIDEHADKMFLVIQGTVDIFHTAEGEEFVIDYLKRGAIINHRSFLLDDQIDTNARCATTVTVFYIEYEALNEIRKRSTELDSAIQTIENEITGTDNSIAIDYIMNLEEQKLRNNERNFKEETHRNELTVKLKNVVMLHWLQVKEARKKPTMKEIL